MFTSDQLESFRVDGFFTYPHFFDKQEVSLLQAEIERLKTEGLLRNVATEGDGVSHSTQKRNLQLCPCSTFSSPFKALPFAAKVVNAMSELIGDPVRVRLDQVFLKPAKDGAGTNWHQDNAYFQLENPLKGAAMWIAVHDASVENGTMHMIPGLHMQKLEHSRDPDSDHHVRCWPDETLEVPCELKAGGVVFFAYGTPHCTKGNSTDRDRAGLAYHFFNANYASQEGAGNSMPYLSSELADGGLAEYGEDQRGKWDSIVANS